MKILTGYIILFIAVFSVNAQVYSFKVEWAAPVKGTDYLPASLMAVNANSFDVTTGLPVMVNTFRMPSGILEDEVQVTAKISLTETFSAEEYEIVEKSGYDAANGIIQDYYISYVDKVPVLNVEVIPVFKDEQGIVRKVLAYSISVDVEEKSNVLKGASAENVNHSYVSGSVLASGKWVKIKISGDGIYRIPYSKLKEWGFNDPAAVRVFGNGGIMLPKANKAPRFDDLRENGTWHHGDAVYFYGKGTVKWAYDKFKKMWVHQLNDFTDDSFYFLSEDAGTGIPVNEQDNSGETANIEVEEYDAYAFHEKELKNLLKSGRVWYGEWFSYYGKQEEEFEFNFPHLVSGEPLMLYTSVAARANVTSYFEMSINGGSMPVQSIKIVPISFSDYTGYFVHTGDEVSSFKSTGDDVHVKVKYSLPSNTSQGWLDFLCLNARCQLVFDGTELQFRDVRSVGLKNIARFTIRNAGNDMVVWDVTDFTRPEKMAGEQNGSEFSFKAKADSLKEYIAFTPGNGVPVPEFVEDVENQDLHAVSNVDYVILAYKDYENEAKRLAALHQTYSGLTTYVVTNEKVYNEFSSGKPDVAAVRDFMRMLYKKASNTGGPKYLLLFGDGSYDNRTYSEDNTNRILTYQAENSIHHAYSYVSDDFFGFLDDNEGDNIKHDMLDIGIGRFPVSTLEQAKAAVNKVESYITKQFKGKWKAKLTFVGDDGDNNLHMRDADRLARKVSIAHPEFDISKIYFDSYQKVTTSTGKGYPEVNELIDKTILEGTLVFNYTGHGGENGLAHERVVDIPMIQNWTNLDRLPLFITATCEFSRFDDFEHTSAGEWVFLNSVGGGIGLFTTTRLVYSSLNFIINNNLYNFIFAKDGHGNKLRLGDIMKKTKNASGSSINILNFTLLSDPALTMVYPSKSVETLEVNDIPVEADMDTIKAMSEAKIKGEVVNGDLTPVVGFNGTMDVVVYDKPSTVLTLGNDGAKPFEYEVFQNKIFTGQVSVKKGGFVSRFMVPKDIRYNIDKARISYYSYGETGEEAFGAINKILVGGISDDPPADSKGPEIKLYLNKSTFVSGGNTGTRPVLYAMLYDENGINTSGIGIGHDLTLVIDDEKSRTMVMNGYYQSETDSYQSGTVVYQLPEQEEGMHKLTLKVWDNLNNSSEAEIEFNVETKGELHVEDVKVFPNPVSWSGEAKFYFTHDEPNMPVHIEMSTYDIGGQLLNREDIKTISQGESIQPVAWHPVNSDGVSLGPGLYIVKFNIVSQSGKYTVVSKKILVVQ
jgi:hypothetical protein